MHSQPSRVLVADPMLPDEPDPGARTIDVIMLAVTGGRERTATELDNLFRAAGLHLTRVIVTASRLRIAEARPGRCSERAAAQPSSPAARNARS